MEKIQNQSRKTGKGESQLLETIVSVNDIKMTQMFEL
jgi:hypothetical protein